MKKLIIIGASGSLAQYVIEELQKQKDVHLTMADVWCLCRRLVSWLLTTSV